MNIFFFLLFWKKNFDLFSITQPKSINNFSFAFFLLFFQTKNIIQQQIISLELTRTMLVLIKMNVVESFCFNNFNVSFFYIHCCSFRMIRVCMEHPYRTFLFNKEYSIETFLSFHHQIYEWQWMKSLFLCCLFFVAIQNQEIIRNFIENPDNEMKSRT